MASNRYMQERPVSGCCDTTPLRQDCTCLPATMGGKGSSWARPNFPSARSQDASRRLSCHSTTAKKLGSTTATKHRRAHSERQDWTETFRWIRSQTLSIADVEDHPIREWLARRNLWRPELPCPPSLRRVPADSPVFKRPDSGAGAIAFPLASVAAWREAFPAVPPPTAAQLMCVGGGGDRADCQNSLAVVSINRSSAMRGWRSGRSATS